MSLNVHMLTSTGSNKVISHNVLKDKTHTEKEYEDQNILKIELIVQVPPLDLSSPEFSSQEQSMFIYRGQFVSPNTPPRGQLFTNSVTSHAYAAADFMDHDNYVGKFSQYIIIESSTS